MKDGQVCIGISTSFVDDEQRVHWNYIRALEKAGAIPAIIPIVEETSTLRAIVKKIDGLVIPGGPAIERGLIGTLPPDIGQTHPARVRHDETLANIFLELQAPIFGICYGMQLVNALADGTIYADVERQVDGSQPHSQKRGCESHSISLEDGSKMRDIYGLTEIEVNSRHIQAIKEVGDGYRVTAWSTDGVIEAIESEDGLVLGVQFHPERMGASGQLLFDHFVQTVAQRQS